MARTYKIAVLPGDGTGPEVIREGCKALDAAGAKYGFRVEKTEYDLGAKRYLRTGETLPQSVVEELRGFQAIYLGALGDPQVTPGILEQGILIPLRFHLDEYINLRPVKLYPGVQSPLRGKSSRDLDYCVIRENTGGLYTNIGGISRAGTHECCAVQNMVYTYFQVARCLRYAFAYARKNGKKARGIGPENTLALVLKTNILVYMARLWMDAFEEIGAEFPDVKRQYFHVDATCLYMVNSPEIFDVIVTENMFGDIITDLAAATQGGLGVAAGGNINPEPGGVSMFEPIGGTAPMWTGKNAINPVAAIGAGAMLLRTLGEKEAADAVEAAIAVTTPKMKSQQANEMGFTTTQVGDLVAGAI